MAGRTHSNFRHIEISSDGARLGGTNRIPPETWERFKDIILDKYLKQKRTLKVVRKEMKEEYEFDATTRQLVHHIGTVWGVKKYKKAGRQQGGPAPNPGRGDDDEEADAEDDGESSTSTTMPDDPPDHSPRNRQASDFHGAPQKPSGPFTATFLGPSLYNHPSLAPEVAFPEQDNRLGQDPSQRLLARLTFAYGDSLAFQICKSLCPPEFREELLADLITCIRAAQTDQEAEQARTVLQRHVDDILHGQDDNSALATLVDLQAAHTYDRGSDANNAKGQIEQRIGDITDDIDGKAQLKILSPRDGQLVVDIPLYVYLNYAVKRWNDDTDDNDDTIEVEDFLDQFLLQQLQQRPAGAIICLPSCLAWCIDVLRQRTAIPNVLRNAFVFQVSAVEATYQLLGTFYSALPRASSASPPPAWIQGAETELGLSGPELLANVTCMIIAQGGLGSIGDVVTEALRRAEILSTVAPNSLLRLFLKHIRWNNDRRMLPRATDRVYNINPASPTIYHRFRQFVFESLGFRLSPDDRNAPIIPLVLAPPAPTPPLMGSIIGNQYLQQGHHMALRSQYGSGGGGW
ncbi:hypothetical protein B0T16DRAFT_457654 [Cercophora newfieldiana]|uniref:Clr5 domain-containing protein n=1 Tax=Cercophora newfieldiana TaxID=92897 RepID=A0AA39Y419_9PEZI|nr:hypothetical protein B0T16DRAFT_457654 [Cercophora newfieldiana]